jgi:hypothetical protein
MYKLSVSFISHALQYVHLHNILTLKKKHCLHNTYCCRNISCSLYTGDLEVIICHQLNILNRIITHVNVEGET